MIPVSILSNSNQPKSSLYAAAEKHFFFYHLNVFQLLKSVFLLTFSLHMDMIVSAWRLTVSGNVILAKKRPVYLYFFVARFLSCVMWRGDNKFIKSQPKGTGSRY